MAQEEVMRYIANTRKIAAWRVIKGNRMENRRTLDGDSSVLLSGVSGKID